MKSILYFFCLIPIVVYSSSYTQCFDQQTRRTISNYQPLVELKLVSLTTCMQNCVFASGNGALESACHSLTYNIKTHSCMLFDHDGYKVPAILHPALGIDLYTRKNDQPHCNGPSRRLEEKKEGNPNFIQLERGQKSISSRTNDITSFRTHDTFDSKEHDHFSNSVRDNRLRARKRARVFAALIHEIDGDIKVPTSVSSSCLNGYYVVLGTEIQKGEEIEELLQSLENVEQGDCAKLCSQNTGFEGKPFNCKSLNYYPSTRKCDLYSIQVEPNGPGKFLANPSTIYSEKFCMPATRKICQNDEVFILHVQKTIIGKKLGENIADGITPCLAQCMAKASCKSAVYDDNKKRCTLYTTDLSEETESLVETLPGSVAIENPCVDNGSRMMASKTFVPKRKTPDEEWSECNFKIEGKLYKVRNYGDQLEMQDC